MSEQKRRISKTLMLRFCAVGVFVCLGTFVVMYAIKIQGAPQTNDDSTATQGNVLSSADETDPLDPSATDPNMPLADQSLISTVSATTDLTNGPSGQDNGSFDPNEPVGESTRFSDAASVNTVVDQRSNSDGNSRSASQLVRPRSEFSFGDSKPTQAEPDSRSGMPPLQPSSSPRTSGFSAAPSSANPRFSNSSSDNNGFSALPASVRNPVTQSTSPRSSGFPQQTQPKSSIPGMQLPPPLVPRQDSPGSTNTSQENSPTPLDVPPIINSTNEISGQTRGSNTGASAFRSPIDRSGSGTANSIQPGSARFDGGRQSAADAETFDRTTGQPNSTNPPRSTSNLLINSATNDSQTKTDPPLRPSFAPSNSSRANNAGLRPSQTIPSRSSQHSGIQSPRGFQTNSSGESSPSLTPIRRPDQGWPHTTNTTGASSSLAQPTPGSRQFEGVQTPAFAIQKIAPREIQVNRAATFETIIKNTGKVAANDVVVHDFVPQGTELIQAVPAPHSNIAGKLQWNLGTLNPGQQSSIKIELMPKQPGQIGSVAHVTFGAQASGHTMCTKPELSIRHKAPTTVLIGEDVVLDIFVENKGNGAAEKVMIQEDVPAGLQFAGGQKELEYEIGTLRPGETRNIRLKLKATQVGHVRNVLVAHGAGKLQATDSVELRIVAPDLTLTGEGPSRKYLNRAATHNFLVSNRGTAAATNMKLVAKLPRGLKFVEANNQGQYDTRAHAVVWRLAKLEAQKTGKVSMTTSPVAIGQHDIEVEATADLDQRKTTRQSLNVQQLVELFFDIDDTADPIETGSGTTYKIRVVNQGQKQATGVRVQVDFPPAITPLSVEGGVRNQIRDQTVFLEPIATMQPGQEISFIVKANGVREGDHRVVVSVRSDDRETPVSKEESTHVYSDR